MNARRGGARGSRARGTATALGGVVAAAEFVTSLRIIHPTAASHCGGSIAPPSQHGRIATFDAPHEETIVHMCRIGSVLLRTRQSIR